MMQFRYDVWAVLFSSGCVLVTLYAAGLHMPWWGWLTCYWAAVNLHPHAPEN